MRKAKPREPVEYNIRYHLRGCELTKDEVKQLNVMTPRMRTIFNRVQKRCCEPETDGQNTCSPKKKVV